MTVPVASSQRSSSSFALRRSIARAERRLRVHRFLEQGFDIGAVVAVNIVEEARQGAVEAVRRQAVQRFEIDRPRQRVGGGVPGPHADARRFKPGANRCRIRKEFCRRSLAVCGVPCVAPCTGPFLSDVLLSGMSMPLHFHLPSLSVKIVIAGRRSESGETLFDHARWTNGYATLTALCAQRQFRPAEEVLDRCKEARR